jgi:pimeloyl-ACP methyl ester carboxylesterase
MEIAWSRSDDGSGIPLLLIHGITDNRATWAPFCRALQKTAPDIPWISQDLRGHGGSSLPLLTPSDRITSEGFRLADYAADAVGLLDALDIDRAILVGHSLGGLIGQKVALTYPDRLQGLAMVATTTDARDNPIFTRDVVGELFGRLLPALAEAKGMRYPRELAGLSMRQLDPSMMTWLRDIWCPMLPGSDPALCAASVEWTADIPLATWFGAFTGLLAMETTDRLKDLRVPSLVVSAARDEIFPVEPDQHLLEQAMAEAHRRHGTGWRTCCYRAIAGGNGSHDVGHAVPWQAADELAVDITAFVRSLR